MSDVPDRRTRVLEPAGAVEPRVGIWLAALEDARQRTHAVVEGASQPEIDVDDPDTGNSIGTLLYHIAAIEADWLFVEVLERDFPPEALALFPYDVRDASGRLTPVRGVSLPGHLDRLRRVRAMLIDALREMPFEEFHRARELEAYVVTPAWILHHLLQHEAEHRGEIGVIRSRQRRDATDRACED